MMTSTQKRELRKWLAVWLAVSVITFLIGFGPLSIGVWQVDVAVILLLSIGFVRWHTLDAKASRADARPREGVIKHRNGSKTKIYFIETSEPGEFLAVDANGERVTMRPGDKLSIDQLSARQSIVINRSQES